MPTWLATMFHQGGPTMYWIEYLSIGALAVAVVGLVIPMAWTRWSSVVLIAAILGVGVYGYVKNKSYIDRIVTGLHDEKPEMLDAIREQGETEALRPIQFAGISAGIFALLFVASEVRRRSRANARRAALPEAMRS